MTGHGVNLAGILGGRMVDQENVMRGEVWGGAVGYPFPPGAMPPPQKKIQFSLKMACFGSF